MPDEFPPIEPRSIVGTGMAADPEAIEDLEEEYARRERADRKPPKKGFGQVLRETPAPPQQAPDTRGKRRSTR